MPMTRTWTEAELMALPEDGMKRELVGGEIVVSAAGWEHGRVIVNLTIILGGYVRSRRLGELCDSSTGIWMPSGNLRLPDLSFFGNERVARVVDRRAFARVTPDLAVEVLSPSDSAADMRAKVAEYLASDVRLVWVIDPESRTASVHRPGASPREIGADGILDGEDVVPGFRCVLGEDLG